MKIFEHLEGKPHPLAHLLENKEFLNKIEDLTKTKMKVKGLINNLTKFDSKNKNDNMIEITKKFGELLN